MGKEKKVEETTEKTLSLEEAFADTPEAEAARLEAAAQGKKIGAEGVLADQLKGDTPSEPQTKTYTQDAVDALLLEEKKAYKGLQGVISKKDTRIRELETVPTPIEGDDKVLELLVQNMRSKEAYGETDPLIPQLEAEVRARKDRQKHETQMRFQQGETNKAWDKINAQITDAGFDPNDERFELVVEAFEDARDFSGKFDRAYTKLDRILSKSKPEKQETETEKDTAEKARKDLEEKGLLTTETGGPSAVSESFEDFQKRYMKSEVSRDEYETRARKEGKLL